MAAGWVPLVARLTPTVTLAPGAPEPPVRDSVAWAAALVTIVAAKPSIATVLLNHPHETRVVVVICPPIQFGFTVSLFNDLRRSIQDCRWLGARN